MPICKKVVIVGEGGCGKTSLLSVFCTNHFAEDNLPTAISENYLTNINIDGKEVKLSVWDTAGAVGYNSIRPLSYPNTDVVIMCYAIDHPNSLWRIAQRWTPEIQQYCPGVPVVLVGNKVELRFDKDTRRRLAETDLVPVCADDGQAMATTIGAYSYLECSAKLNEAVVDVFQVSTRAALKKKKKKGMDCTLL